MALINVLLITGDGEYAQRLTGYMGRKHQNDLRMMVLDTPDSFEGFLKTSSVSVVIIDEDCRKIDVSMHTEKAFLYLRESSSGIKDEHTLCKYSSGEEIYRAILGLYSEISVNSRDANARCRIFGFVDSDGGAGASSVSAAFAMNQAQNGLKVLHLCFDKRTPEISFFGQKANGSMSDLITAVMSKSQSNLAAKAASLIRTDPSGVSYIQGCALPNDYDEIDAPLLEKLVNACIRADDFNCVVIDGSLQDNSFCERILPKVSTLVVVSQNGDASFEKLSRTVEWLRIYASRRNDDLLSHTKVVVNRVKIVNGRLAAPEHVLQGVRYAGTVPLYGNGSLRSIALAISRLPLNNELLN